MLRTYPGAATLDHCGSAFCRRVMRDALRPWVRSVLAPMYTQSGTMLRCDSEQGTETESQQEAETPMGTGLDQTAFEALYVAEEKAVYNTVYRWVWHEQEAMDVVQEAFVRLWRARHKVEPTQAKAYVFRIALNLASNRLRTRKLWQWTGLGEFFGQYNQEHEVLADERQRRIRAAVEDLPEKIRKVVVLVRFAEMSYQQIAELLGIPSGTVGSRYNRGLKLLEGALQDLGRHDDALG